MAVVRPIPVPAILRPSDRARPAEKVQAATLARFRRCTFRRVEATKIGRELAVYDVACMYPDRVTPLPLGNLAAAHPVCATCTNTGIFRADSD
jgi:hypothetical protein